MSRQMMKKSQVRMDEGEQSTEIRMDISDTLGEPVRTPEGYWRFDVALTRSGVFTYLNKDGTKRVEYRPPDEVAKATPKMAGLPFTLRHPSVLLSGKDTKKHMVGAVLAPRFDGEWSRGNVIVYEESDVEKMRAEGLGQTSQGYAVDYDPTPGVTPDGVRYDGVQTNIRPNHQSAVQQARAGSDCKIRLDGASYSTLEPMETTMFKHADGTPFATQAALDAYSKVIFERDQAKGRADAAEASVPKEDQINARLKERRKLERSADTVASKMGTRADGIEDLSDRDLKVKVIQMVTPDFDGKDMPDGEIQGWYKSSLSQALAKAEDRKDSVETPAPTAPRTDSVEGVSKGVPDPRKPKEGRKNHGPRGTFATNAQRKALAKLALSEL